MATSFPTLPVNPEGLGNLNALRVPRVDPEDGIQVGLITDGLGNLVRARVIRGGPTVPIGGDDPLFGLNTPIGNPANVAYNYTRSDMVVTETDVTTRVWPDGNTYKYGVKFNAAHEVVQLTAWVPNASPIP